ncbi:hypothetical protein [uncultured Paracoccus sp.]|uniref:hypothetical protein n=1 Tax=uncultured Paracoccus sp. TaxID=189685 RepID=UPI0025D5B279|nr:hypothetical protein [uncultured Paracoccus sp.]
MRRLLSSLTLALTLAAAPGLALAQDHVLIDGPFAMLDIEEAIASAHNVTSPDWQASAPYPRDRQDGDKMIAVTRNGVPVLAYRPELYGHDGWQPDVTFSCGPGGTIDITQLLFGYAKGTIPPDGARLQMHIRPFGQDDNTIPVTLVETLGDPRGLIRVHGRVRADEPFFRNLRPTTNLQTQLLVDGQYVQFSGGGDLSSFDTTVRPLLALCAGNAANRPATPPAPQPSVPQPSVPAPRTASGTPDQADIKAALEARLGQQMAVYDGMASQCNNVRDSDNPMAAIACMMSGFGMTSSQNMGMTIHGVDLDECVLSDSGVAYCRYRVRAEMRGNGMMGQVAELANMGLALNQWSYGGFEQIRGQWSLVRAYDHCSWGNGQINCTWRD